MTDDPTTTTDDRPADDALRASSDDAVATTGGPDAGEDLPTGTDTSAGGPATPAGDQGTDATSVSDDVQDAAADGDHAPAGDGDHAPDGHELAEEAQPDWDELAIEDGRSSGQLLEALSQTQSDRDDYLDALQRSRAEFDNFRRRSAREAAGARTAGKGDLAIQLLDVLDDLDRTVTVAEHSSDEGLAAGITAIRRKLVDALLAAGVERIDTDDIAFDATQHEAVQKVDADEPLDEPEVAQVLRPGYRHGDRILRAAMVVVRQ